MVNAHEQAIIIPSLDPDQRLLDLVANIRQGHDSQLFIVVVNDGSDPSYDTYFDQLKAYPRLKILKHDQNYGKGRALKTAFRYLLDEQKQIQSAVTIDSDGQHTFEDMMACLKRAQEEPEAFIFGARHFGEDVPLRSKFGNIMTRKLLKFLTGMNLEDTQTGLRVIPSQYFEPLLAVEGDRFEYEMNMILFAKKHQIPIIEVAISTIYLDDNASSHFKVLRDSFAIYSVFLKYVAASLVSFLIDLACFAICLALIGKQDFTAITTATVIARCISALANYVMNRLVVFRANSRQSLLKYGLLVMFQMLSSSLLVTAFTHWISFLPTTLIKVFVDSFLFILNYYIQKHFIFHTKEHSDGL
ncbi:MULTISPECIES: bifunctional glycosyltransferase family 2/GtrA family protein [Aerococcus]|uniref:Glycosyltransferase n=1 Tax=Aerococcus sanguinicola TaxID=119206 RepID=A0A5N1GJN1_9LACT|nr:MULTISPECIES: bifunctional glycosyltransferase family 2/GtrA family protein [Aerococcus]KAA9300546.1 glycosyltransferase [Aerococcus sanguinicola]MDK6369657.1 bifunctional glycosyltransferase family 2/GtrA family protein [Aerococcus sp. UMB9870]MDK6680162.1 bifunctional glycosyltransferase family 2/GtrA family protein [Aerococcus sp. UMB8608]MDK6686323.1 bifunctional glycosyltransferase family 2/GtrA family protein [Aerococcus sp. UMB8623]MDK6940243.1 bifunctional glycosyltransferase family